MSGGGCTLGTGRKWKRRRTPNPSNLHRPPLTRFGWRVGRHVESNAVVFATTDSTIGIGAGQMSRIDSSRIAVWKAEESGLKKKDAGLDDSYKESWR